MATPQLSPGVLVREVDLTVGRADNVLDNIGAIAGPFQIGPIDEPIDISSEQALISTFGKPVSTNAQYEYWMSASSYLTYGGVLKVVRTDGSTLNCSNAGVGIASTNALKIKSYDNYLNDFSEDNTFTYASKTPGTWGNGLKVCQIDAFADQTLGITTTNLAGLGVTVGYGITSSLDGKTIPGDGSTSSFSGYLKGIITGVNTATSGGTNSTIDVKVVSRVSSSTTSFVDVLGTQKSSYVDAGAATTSFLYVDSVSGLTAADSVTLLGITPSNIGLVSVGSTFVELNAEYDLQHSNVAAGTAVTFSTVQTTGGVETAIDYAEGTDFAAFTSASVINVTNTSSVETASTNVASIADWYDAQTLGLTNATTYWKTIAPKPTSTNYTTSRSGKNDEMHVVVVDDDGTLTGVKGNILEKHLGLSKALDAVSDVNSPQRNYYKQYLADFSSHVYAGYNISQAADAHWKTTPRATGFSAGFTPVTLSDGLWGVDAQGVTYSATGNTTYDLTGGVDYSANGGYEASLANLMTSYGKFQNKDEIEVDYLIMGPGLSTRQDSQAKANYLLSLANQRKDCVTTVGPHRTDLVGLTNTTDQTTNLIKYFSPLSSTSYGIFDSGYKYTYDRFNNKFRWIPTNADVAGLMTRTNIVAYPWFSPAGQQRGIINNAVKLAYNPTKAQRDQLYPQRINSFITTPGLGTLLFGDKTALGYASAFDRINVRRLFLTIEQALQRAAEAQHFELNDELTRANFRNIVEPYLRDVQAKRGLYGFLVVCDETNNTPDVIDNNEFRADIFLKPAKSINYVTLTFVATRTGVSFEEVAGRV